MFACASASRFIAIYGHGLKPILSINGIKLIHSIDELIDSYASNVLQINNINCHVYFYPVITYVVSIFLHANKHNPSSPAAVLPLLPYNTFITLSIHYKLLFNKETKRNQSRKTTNLLQTYYGLHAKIF